MWPKFLEDLAPTQLSVGGKSRADGFDITFRSRSGKKRVVRFLAPEGEYPKQESVDMRTCIVMALITCFALWAHAWTISLTIALLAVQQNLFHIRFKSWHWCEHQIAALLADGYVPTEGLLRSQSPILTRCGSVQQTSLRIYFGASLAVLVHLYLGQESRCIVDALLAVSGCAVFIAHRNTEIQCMGWLGRFAFYGLCYVGLPVFMICLAVERFFFLRRPSQEQSEYAVRFGQKASLYIAQKLLEDAAAEAHQPAP